MFELVIAFIQVGELKGFTGVEQEEREWCIKFDYYEQCKFLSVAR